MALRKVGSSFANTVSSVQRKIRPMHKSVTSWPGIQRNNNGYEASMLTLSPDDVTEIDTSSISRHVQPGKILQKFKMLDSMAQPGEKLNRKGINRCQNIYLENFSSIRDLDIMTQPAVFKSVSNLSQDNDQQETHQTVSMKDTILFKGIHVVRGSRLSDDVSAPLGVPCYASYWNVRAVDIDSDECVDITTFVNYADNAIVSMVAEGFIPEVKVLSVSNCWRVYSSAVISMDVYHINSCPYGAKIDCQVWSKDVEQSSNDKPNIEVVCKMSTNGDTVCVVKVKLAAKVLYTKSV